MRHALAIMIAVLSVNAYADIVMLCPISAYRPVAEISDSLHTIVMFVLHEPTNSCKFATGKNLYGKSTPYEKEIIPVARQNSGRVIVFKTKDVVGRQPYSKLERIPSNLPVDITTTTTNEVILKGWAEGKHPGYIYRVSAQTIRNFYGDGIDNNAFWWVHGGKASPTMYLLNSARFKQAIGPGVVNVCKEGIVSTGNAVATSPRTQCIPRGKEYRMLFAVIAEDNIRPIVVNYGTFEEHEYAKPRWALVNEYGEFMGFPDDPKTRK